MNSFILCIVVSAITYAPCWPVAHPLPLKLLYPASFPSKTLILRGFWLCRPLPVLHSLEEKLSRYSVMAPSQELQLSDLGPAHPFRAPRKLPLSNQQQTVETCAVFRLSCLSQHRRAFFLRGTRSVQSSPVAPRWKLALADLKPCRSFLPQLSQFLRNRQRRFLRAGGIF